MSTIPYVTQKRNGNGKRGKTICVIGNHNNGNSGFLVDASDEKCYSGDPDRLV
ncbi:MAG: hypothetical protein ACP5JW_01835 [Candidatus Bathyarchaeia archaeon]